MPTSPNRRRAACTIVSPNYLPFARALARSYLAAHPGHRFFALLVCRDFPVSLFEREPFDGVRLADIGLAELNSMAFKYEILELNTAVKPAFLRHLLTTYDLDSILYLDPDIFIYAPLTHLFEAAEAHGAVLIPHITTPFVDDRTPTEIDMLVNGIYNLGFIGLGRGEAGAALVDWWHHRCVYHCFAEGQRGLFVDQKWLDLAPTFFPGIAVDRHPGANMAYWNLHERALDGPGKPYTVNGGQPLFFFHFSGLDRRVDSDAISRNTDRYTLHDRPELRNLFGEYRKQVNLDAGTPAENVPYGFDRFSNGYTITRMARRAFAVAERDFRDTDPFDANGPFYRLAAKRGLLAGKRPIPRIARSEVSQDDRRIQAMNLLLRTLLRMLGPNRYALLMKYMAYISLSLHQHEIFSDHKDKGGRL